MRLVFSFWMVSGGAGAGIFEWVSLVYRQHRLFSHEIRVEQRDPVESLISNE